MAFSAPVGLSWDSPPPPTECADGRTYGCTDVRMYGRTDGHVTITSQPKFLGLIGYQTELNNVCACARRGEVWGPEWFQILRDL